MKWHTKKWQFCWGIKFNDTLIDQRQWHIKIDIALLHDGEDKSVEWHNIFVKKYVSCNAFKLHIACRQMGQTLGYGNTKIHLVVQTTYICCALRSKSTVHYIFRNTNQYFNSCHCKVIVCNANEVTAVSVTSMVMNWSNILSGMIQFCAIEFTYHESLLREMMSICLCNNQCFPHYIVYSRRICHDLC